MSTNNSKKQTKKPEFNVESKLAEIKGTNFYPVNNSAFRRFEPGTKVQRGNIKEVHVVEQFEDYQYYHIHEILEGTRETDFKDTERHSIVAWVDLDPFRDVSDNKQIAGLGETDRWRLSYQQRDISGLLHLVYHFGLKMDPPYQREFVWKETDKQDLIASIFQNVDIGKFTMAKLDWSKNGHGYEVIDGKQRVGALLDFHEDKFAFKGKFYSQLKKQDQNHFNNHPVSMAFSEHLTEQDKVNLFLRLNFSGVPQDIEHFKKVGIFLNTVEAATK